MHFVPQAHGRRRATFLPLNTIRANSLRETGLERQNGCFGAADALVRFNEKYKNIVCNLLARTVISENMDTALALAKRTDTGFALSP